MLIAYKYRIYPEKDTLIKLERNLELCRWVYNRLLEEKNKAREEKRKLSDFDAGKLIIKLRKTEKPELSECNARMLGMIPQRMSASIRALSQLKKNGHKIGGLKFKAYDQYNTLAYNQSGYKIDQDHGTLELAKIGVINARFHRTLPDGRVKGIVITRRNNKWYASIQVEIPDNVHSRVGDRKVVLSFGLDHIVADSDGSSFKHPHYYLKSLGKIKKRQRDVSRKKKGSANRSKAIAKLGKAHDKAEAQRDDYLHWISRFYVDHYDHITIIKPDIKEAIKTSKDTTTNRNILDAGISKLISMIEYKAKHAGVKVVITPIIGKNINKKNVNIKCAGAGSAGVSAE